MLKYLVATSEKTKKEDQRLRDELINADMGKFKKLIKPLIIKNPKQLRSDYSRSNCEGVSCYFSPLFAHSSEK